MFNKKEEKTGEEKPVKYVINDDSLAREELQKIDDFFDAEYSTDSEILIEHIKKGMLYLDEDQAKVIYKLLAPIEKKDGALTTEIKLEALLLKDILAIGKKLSVNGNAKEEFMISMTYDLERTYQMVVKCGNIPIGLVDRLKKRDLRLLSEVLDFLQ